MNIGQYRVLTAHLTIMAFISPILPFIKGPNKHDIKMSIFALIVFLMCLAFRFGEGDMKPSLKNCVIAGLIAAPCAVYMLNFIVGIILTL
ncbi:hypothetical protein [Pseudomonas sp.]|jgi:hypothetical protein|uniref:hypothetical protein n=1 Tax=Pseudomonas sp. TaxID=306 RepID=UPI003D6F6C59